MTVALVGVMTKFHDTPLGAPGAEMEALYEELLTVLEDHPGVSLTLSQCKVVVRHGCHSDPIVDEEVSRLLMEEFKAHYPGDHLDYLDSPICIHENLRE
jgi:hypothetical protein